MIDDDELYEPEYPDDDDRGEYCLWCDGEGVIVTCFDDLCRARGACIHGDGEQTCPECDGRGW